MIIQKDMPINQQRKFVPTWIACNKFPVAYSNSGRNAIVEIGNVEVGSTFVGQWINVVQKLNARTISSFTGYIKFSNYFSSKN